MDQPKKVSQFDNSSVPKRRNNGPPATLDKLIQAWFLRGHRSEVKSRQAGHHVQIAQTIEVSWVRVTTACYRMKCLEFLPLSPEPKVCMVRSGLSFLQHLVKGFLTLSPLTHLSVISSHFFLAGSFL